jgi:hypothetical protein
MKTLILDEKPSPTVGQIVDAMHSCGEFAPLGREDIFAVVERFITDYVGIPGSFVSSPMVMKARSEAPSLSKKFTPEDADKMAADFGLSRETIVRIVAVFRMKAAPQSSMRTKFMKAYGKIRGKHGGMKTTPVSRM